MALGDYRPKAVSEWFDPDGHIDQCGWCSSVMLANKASLGAYPATLDESKKLGQGASSITDNNTALGREHGWHAQPYDGDMAGFLAALTPGMGALVQGYYAGLPKHFTRFDPGFAAKGMKSRHATYVQREPDGRIWWIDPLFHSEPGYKGEFITVAALSAYATTYHTKVLALLALEGSHDPSQSGPAVGGDMLKISSRTPVLIDLPVGKQLYDLAGNPTVPITGAIVGQVSPYEVEINPTAHYRAAVVTIKGVVQLGLIHIPDANVRPLPAVVQPAPDCSVQDAKIVTLEATVKDREDRLRRSSAITTL